MNNYYKALRVYQAARKRLEERLNAARISQNVKIGAEAARVLIRLEMADMSMLGRERFKKMFYAKTELERLAAALSEEPGEEISKSELLPFFRVCIQALDNGIMPGSELILGNQAESELELRRIAAELERHGKNLQIEEDFEE